MKKWRVVAKILFAVTALVSAAIFSEYIFDALHYTNYKSDFSLTSKQAIERYGLYQLDNDKIYALKPNRNSVYEENQTDAQGFRFQPHISHLAGLTTQIITVGDSFTYGHGVPLGYAYPAVLETMLNTSSTSAVVHNAGVSGFGPDQEFVYIKQLLRRQKINVLVWNFNMNDLVDADEACLITKIGNTYIQEPGWLNSIYIHAIADKILPPALLNSHIGNLLLYAPNILLHKTRVTLGCTGRFSPDQIISKIVYLIKTVHTLTKSRGILFITTLVPYQYYFDSGLTNHNAALQNYQQLRDALTHTGSYFIDTNAQIAKKYDAPLARIRDEMTASNNPERKDVAGAHIDDLAHNLFLSDDTEFPYGWKHLNALGNRYFAEVVSAAIFSGNNSPLPAR